VAEERYLFTPGPTPVPPEVLAALAEPVVHHRGPDYRALFGEVLERLQAVCRTENDVLLFTSSGTGAMESAVANLCSPGDRVSFRTNRTPLARARDGVRCVRSSSTDHPLRRSRPEIATLLPWRSALARPNA
jgi:hypothetical protein